MVKAQRLSEVFRAVGPLYREAARRVASEERIENVSTGVRAVLEHLASEGSQTVPAVARALGTSRQYVQKMADEAHEAGLLRFTSNPSHRRSSIVELTPEGQATIERILRRERLVLRSAALDLTDAEVDACLRVLHRLRRATTED